MDEGKIIFDFSKNLLDEEIFQNLLNLAKHCDLSESIQRYFRDNQINETEGRAVSHMALRNFDEIPWVVGGKDVMPKIYSTRKRLKSFTEEVISGDYKGYTDKPIKDVVNIGIGGSDLGPAMLTSALRYYKNRLNVHYISNVDGNHLVETLQGLDPETTLFIIVSKTFTTQETMVNARSARQWFLRKAKEKDIAKHFVAVSASLDEAGKFGIEAKNCFEFWDWVGGRFSVWSAVGLSVALALGWERFEELLKGAFQVDQHFRTAPLEDNIPVLMGLIGIWNRNFLNAPTLAIVPYSQYLDRFAAFLQQADMESNGKSVDREGKFVPYATGPVVFGKPGTNGQHAFYQEIHQGTDIIPCDFIGFVRNGHLLNEHQEVLMANFFAQTQALAFGKSIKEVEEMFKQNGFDEEYIRHFAGHRVFRGNIPTNSLLIDELSPYTMGQLIALYEHKIFVQGVIWNIYSYDQWGVELGKVLANKILPDLQCEGGEVRGEYDVSTSGLIGFYKKTKNKFGNEQKDWLGN